MASDIGTICADGHVVSKSEHAMADKVGVDAKLVREDNKGTGVYMVMTNMAALKKFTGRFCSWSPNFMSLNVSTNGKEKLVSINGSGYNQAGEKVKSSSKTGM